MVSTRSTLFLTSLVGDRGGSLDKECLEDAECGPGPGSKGSLLRLILLRERGCVSGSLSWKLPSSCGIGLSGMSGVAGGEYCDGFDGLKNDADG
jgi:hypothetical protein